MYRVEDGLQKLRLTMPLIFAIPTFPNLSLLISISHLGNNCLFASQVKSLFCLLFIAVYFVTQPPKNPIIF